MKILFISQYYPPEMGALASRASELCRIWAEMGNEVTVLTGFPNYPSGVIPKRYRGLKRKVENVDGVKIVRTYVYAGHYKGRINRILNYFSFLFSGIFFGKNLIDQPDVIIGSSPPILVPVIGYVLSKVKKVPFVFEVRDLWPESIIQISNLSNPVVITILKKLELFLYKKASLIVPVTNSFKKYISDLGIDKSKIDVIKNGVDLGLFNPSKKLNYPKNFLHLKDKFILAYIGNHGMAQGLSTIIKVADSLQNNEEIHFLFVGDGAEKPLLEKEAAELDNVTFMGQVKKENMPEYYAIANVVLVPLRNLELFSTVIPSKIFEIMAMKKPIIITVSGEVKKLVVDDAEAGLFAEPENIDSIKTQIIRLYKSRQECASLGKNGRVFVENFYSRRSSGEKYLQLLENL